MRRISARVWAALLAPAALAAAATGLLVLGGLARPAETPGAAPAAAPAAPTRVVSMNLCTDQLAILIAGEGQLHSVSHLAGRPDASVLAEAAQAFAVNHGRAEEIFMMRPDLIIAGRYTTRATVGMLQRLGFRVEEFAPAHSFDDIRANIRRMGALLGREARAEALVAEFDQRLAEIDARAADRRRLRVALYFANNYTSGRGSLSDEALAAAGHDNIAAELGVAGIGALPLESLVMSDPDAVVGRVSPAEAPSLAYENYAHPALRATLGADAVQDVPSKYW
ncbi:MAG: ABC transporter substrate-binding protein, partial [Pseudomonadota bacterium]